MSEPIWVRNDVVLATHHHQLAEHGGGMGVRDQGLLESALARPKQLYSYTDPKPSIHALAASYAFGIAKNHPFVDGNKRTSFVICQLFLQLNGWKLNAPQPEKYTIWIALASSQLSEQQLAQWITKNSTLIKSL